MKRRFPISLVSIFLFLCAGLSAGALYAAADAGVRDAAEVRLALEKLDVLGSVLYIAAHPDDENTGLIAYWAKERKYRAGYLSVTRGDGGQNLIGTEKGADIGILRSQELLAARRIDGGEQFFTRAIDFGYSKSVAETFGFWGHDRVLADVVWVIRNFRPDVIVTRFPTEEGGGGGHGHHTASAILAVEAFAAAADPGRFPEQLEHVKPWKTRRILLNSFRFGAAAGADDDLPGVDIGAYNPLLGQSYNELAGRSRSMHKSQGFGSLPSSGSQMEYFKQLDGEPARGDIMDGVDVSWSRVAGGGAVARKIADILASYRGDDPAALLPALLELDAEMARLGDDPWVSLKRRELLDLIRDCAGLRVEAFAEDYSASPQVTGLSQNATAIDVSVIQRTGRPLRVRYLGFPRQTLVFRATPDGMTRWEIGVAEEGRPTDGWRNGADVRDYTYYAYAGRDVPHNVTASIRQSVLFRPQSPVSQPYWLREPPEEGAYVVADQRDVGPPENLPAFSVAVALEIMGETFAFVVPVRYRWVERAEGERQRPFEVRPPVTADFKQKVAVFHGGRDGGAGEGKEIAVTLKNHDVANKGTVRLEAPEGWAVEPEAVPFEFAKRHGEKVAAFRVRPPAGAEAADVRAVVDVDGEEYSYSLAEIDYPHIDAQVHFTDAVLRLVPLDARPAGRAKKRLGYIMGSGDDLPEILKDMGYEVTLLDDEALNAEALSGLDIVVAGIRAYNTRERMRFAQPLLMDFVKNGGTYIVQYNVNTGLQTADIGPYPFKVGRDRIVEEDAELRPLDPAHPLLVAPNAIAEDDFEGWVQERGLYFAEQWDGRYTPLFAGHDAGERDLEGGTLYCEYGEGVFVYTSLAFFRQLPAGVPGAFRLFQNMLEARKR
jgi:LmbE family N-acetylglucosaminyl deacetylase